jgi:hypothetical protein
LDKDQWAGFTHTGEIIRNARIFGFIDESETCQGWRMDQIEELWDKVNAYWDQHGAQANNLPPDVFTKFERIHAEALDKAKALGWTPEDWLTASDFDGWIKEEDLAGLVPPEWLERADRHR